LRVAYADPPYPGMAHFYKDHPDYAGEVDHAELIGRLNDDFDAWILHTASTTLWDVLPLCPRDVRVMAWTKTFASFKLHVTTAYAWEPVITHGGRKRPETEPTVRDWFACPITLQRGLVGVKPEAVCIWIFDALGLTPDDELVDLFPGSGAIARAWETFCRQGRLAVSS